MHFDDCNPADLHFIAYNMLTEDPMVIMMDPKVLIINVYIHLVEYIVIVRILRLMLFILIIAQRQEDSQQRGEKLSSWVNKDAKSRWSLCILVLLERGVHLGPEPQFLPYSQKANRGIIFN